MAITGLLKKNGQKLALAATSACIEIRNAPHQDRQSSPRRGAAPPRRHDGRARRRITVGHRVCRLVGALLLEQAQQDEKDRAELRLQSHAHRVEDRTAI
jgi:hypothetical protein